MAKGKKGRVTKTSKSSVDLSDRQTDKLDEEVAKCSLKHEGSPGAEAACVEKAVNKIVKEG